MPRGNSAASRRYIQITKTATAASPNTRAGICHHCENPSISPLVMRYCTRSEEARRHSGEPTGEGSNACTVKVSGGNTVGVSVGMEGW
jgi:hypothetical protein